ncbi:MAG: hypothetical protein KDC78_00320 [Aequorivita sp.]|nr:hypothetical protein [Aequorivita sp.]
MKLTKLIFLFVLTLAAVSCSKDDNNDPEPYNLTNANLAGTYKISAVSGNSTSTTNVSGTTVTIATTTVVGDTFQVSIIFNENGTYTATGQYRIVTTITPTGQDPIVSEEILVVDSSGSYSVNSSNQTITFNSNDDSFVEGLFDVTLFNNTTFNLMQEDVTTDGGITTTSEANINLTRV